MPGTLVPVSGPCCCFTAFFLFGGLAATAYGVKDYQLVQKIENTPTSKVRSAAVGLVELKGRARCRETFESPISRAKCAYWRVKADYWQQGRRSGHWVNFFSESSSKPFYLEDDTGKMLVDPSGGEVGIKTDFQSSGNLSGTTLFGLLPTQQLDRKVLDFLERRQDAKARFQQHSGQQMRVYESYIEDGDELYALGSAEPLEGASSDVHYENLILHKGKGEQFMFVSDSSEAIIVGTRKWTALAALFVGLAITAASLIMIFLSLTSFAV